MDIGPRYSLPVPDALKGRDSIPRRVSGACAIPSLSTQSPPRANAVPAARARQGLDEQGVFGSMKGFHTSTQVDRDKKPGHSSAGDERWTRAKVITSKAHGQKSHDGNYLLISKHLGRSWVFP